MATHAIRYRKDREKLDARREPYWHPLNPGTAVGFRCSGPIGSARGTWIARLRTPNHPDHQHEYHALKRDAEGNPIEDFDAAKKAADAWFATMQSGGRRSLTRGTVRDAIEAYVTDLRAHGRETADDIEGRFKRGIYEARIASLRLESVALEDFEAWRESLRSGRQARSVNRLVRSVTAALNYAVKRLGHVGNRAAWNLTAITDDVEDQPGDAVVFLNSAQRSRLIRHAGKDLQAYLRGLEHTGARPSELAKATVADFDKAHGILTLRHRKSRSAKLKIRAVGLTEDAVKFFTAQARGREPTAPLISKDGERWRTFEWSRGIRAAITAANEKAKPTARIPVNASAYSFRHARISELLQVHKWDPFTVAQQTGTSMVMFEKYYFKVVPADLQAKLKAMVAA